MFEEKRFQEITIAKKRVRFKYFVDTYIKCVRMIGVLCEILII